MRLRTSADRHEIRQQYLPSLWNKTVGILKDEGKEAVQDVIDFMDSYYLTRDDFDAVLELGVGNFDMEKIKIESSTKAAFTRMYNSQNHPMPFVKASNVMGLAKAGAKREKPDLEEAVEDSEGEEALADADPAADDDELDLKKDKYIKAPKKKTAKAAAGGAAKGKGKRKKADEDDDDDSAAESEQEPKKKRASTGAGRGRGGGRGRGRGKA